ncbi:SDR family NAD(P)-dependent oxidoreductase [Actinomycetospora straminea]|uniref:SDR family NAD(P)-dependent oxidoreductase n=1 Tax=Actinomycetospora straminea TaxID=663607 RepID=A0ABP9EE89_9PSEU|nr:SDR family NAD(P)-dependent oxidoreductase [Actinomycetospora straminea]MDD7934319.1 SDR family NAD(P)-dependent oxidoreductase [Actinomycetospora straminea]
MSTALITGASRGLGVVAARRLAAQGWTVLAGCREPARLAATLTAADGDIRPIPLDVTDDASVEATVKEVSAHTDTLDVLVNNAAIVGVMSEPAVASVEDLRAAYETNVFGPVRVTRPFLPLLRRSAVPRLVMVSSSLGSLAEMSDWRWDNHPHLAYPSAKAALNMLSVMYAKTVPDVLVTVVNPGFTATDLNDHQGTQTVEEGTDAIVAAALDTTGPSGRFLDRFGTVPW